MTELTVDEHGRPEPPFHADEVATLLGFLDWQRATLAWKCRGLDAAGLSARLGPSTITLGGLLRHCAYYEDAWFSRTLWACEPGPAWTGVDGRLGQEWDWSGFSPDELFELWESSVARSRELVAAALTDGGLAFVSRQQWPEGPAPSLRWTVCHMIEEYARHNGHADLIRESIDGSVGE